MPALRGVTAARRPPCRAVADQFPDQHVLGVVGVLVLVHQHVPEPAPVGLGHLGEGLQQEHRVHDQVVEVHRARRDQPALVLAVGLGQRLLPVALRPGGEGLVVDQLVLELGHLGEHRLRRMVLGVEVQLAADQGHQPLRVGLVVDRERRRVAEPRLPPGAGSARTPSGRSSPTCARARAPVSAAARAAISPAALLVNVIARISPGLTSALRQQVGDPAGQHAGLARARAGHDEQRAALVQDGGRCCGFRSSSSAWVMTAVTRPSVGGATDAAARRRARPAAAAGSVLGHQRRRGTWSGSAA